MTNYEPEKCGYSLYLYGVYICGLTATPCKKKYGNECAAEISDKSARSLIKKEEKNDLRRSDKVITSGYK